MALQDDLSLKLQQIEAEAAKLQDQYDAARKAASLLSAQLEGLRTQQGLLHSLLHELEKS